MAPKEARVGVQLPIIYTIFFLFLEPISALVGAYYSYFDQATYLGLLDVSSSHVANAGSASSSAAASTIGTSVALSQLSNMYFFFALNEAIVLRASPDIRVWRAVLFVLLVADLGHLFSLKELGSHIYFDVGRWNASDWGNVPWVYAGATLRLCFLLGVGLGHGKDTQKKQ
jgi:hypothetical protein